MNLDAFHADCEELAEKLRSRQVDRERRRDARALLQRAFQVGEGESPDPVAVEEVQAELRELLGKGEVVWEPMALRLERTFWPVKIETSVRLTFADRLTDTYLRLGDRLQEVSDWFWERCSPDKVEKGDKTVADKALEEFGETDMEYVWGKRRRPPPH